MLLERLELHHYCNHVDRTVDFQPGLTAIIGANGSGKSNLMGAVRLAITGENPNAGKKEENISKRAGKKEPSFVRLRFSHGNVRATVKRNLRPSRPTPATLEIEGQPTVTGEEAVNTRISEILGGLAADVFNGLIFVAQREVFAIFDKTPAKRAEHLQFLFSLDAAERAHDAVSKRVSQLEIPVVTADMAQLQNQEGAAANRIAELQVQLDATPTHEYLALSITTFRAVAASCQQARQLETEIARAAEQGAAATEAATQYRQQAATASAAVTSLEPRAAAAATAAIDFGRDLAAYQAYAMHVHRKEQLECELNAIRGDPVLTVPLPAPPADYWADADRQEQTIVFGNAFARAAEAYSRIERASEKPDVACPTCGAPAPHLRDQLPSLRQTMEEKQRELAGVHDRLKRSQAYELECSALQSQKSQHAGKIQQLERQLSLMVPPPFAQPPAPGVADLAATAAELHRKLAVARADLAAAQQQAAANDTRNEAATAAFLSRRSERAAIAIPSAELSAQEAAAGTETACAQALDAQRYQLERELAVAGESLRSVRSRLADARRDIAAAADLRAFADYAGKLQSLLHRDGAPKFVIHKNLCKLERRINPLLQELGAEFQISIDESLSFVASFPDGMTMPGERLSPGQQVSLALCFRLAMNLSLAGQVGALYLDEPTVYLDAEHIRGLEPLFMRLRDLSAASALQIIVVTHEAALAPLFDNTIQL